MHHSTLFYHTPVESFKIEITGVGSCLMGELARVYLNYTQATAAPVSVVAKFGLYETESNFYRELRPQLKINAPQCFANEHDLQFGLCTLLMSDIIGNTVDQVAGRSPARAKVAVSAN
ncbi:MAG: hypothetical protein ACJAVI_005291 [Candidatus Azotimanducaceae bacterium]|jgi:hypothetical protein